MYLCLRHASKNSWNRRYSFVSTNGSNSTATLVIEVPLQCDRLLLRLMPWVGQFSGGASAFGFEKRINNTTPVLEGLLQLPATAFAVTVDLT